MGREVKRQTFTQNKVLIQRNGLAAGLYFFKVENGGKRVTAGKLVVR